MVTQMHVIKKIIDDVLLDGKFGVNIVTDFKNKLKLFTPKLGSYTLNMINQTL
jgi:hypothetical protein